MPTTPTPATGDLPVVENTDTTERPGSVIALEGGGFAATYTAAPSGSAQPFLQLFDANGWPGLLIVIDFYGAVSPTVARLTGGDFVVAWRGGTTSFAQRVQADGTFIGSATVTPGVTDPAVVALDNGGYAVIATVSGTSSRLVLVDEDGAQTASLLITGGSANVTVLPDGNVFVVSTLFGTAIGRVFSPAGDLLVDTFNVGTFTTNISQPFPATLADGRVVVSYVYNDSGHLDVGFVFVTVNAGAGSAAVSPHGYMTAADGLQTTGRIVALNDGGFIGTWVDQTGADGELGGIFGQRFDEDGVAVGAPFVVNEEPAVAQTLQAGPFRTGAQLQDGRVVYLFQTGANGTDALVRIFNVDGNPASPAPPIVGTGGNDMLDGTTGADTVNAGAGSDTINGLDGADVLNGEGGKDFLYGGIGADQLNGGDGGDLLDGGAGDDVMAGGTGDDTYVVDSNSDAVTEVGGEGNDRVRASVQDYTIGANVEHLQLLVGGITGRGNALNNQIDGNSDLNSLYGADGNDILRGHDGADILAGDAGDDMLVGGADNDLIAGGADNDRLYGDNGDDQLIGGVGIDVLEGGAGADDLFGDDGADQLFGGADADDLVGGLGNDRLDGGTGDDKMTGGAGDDTYYVDSSSDTVIEASGGGNDVVRSLVNWNLGADVERLILEGSDNIEGNGNEGDNQITGNGGSNILYGNGGKDTVQGGGGDDTLVGGTGNDILTGGLGADTFLVLPGSVYSSLAPNGATLEVDTISDFTAGVDIIDLSPIDSGDADGAFNLVANFTRTAGQMTLKFAGGVTTLSLDVDGDAKADYQLRINGDVTGASGNWVL